MMTHNPDTFRITDDDRVETCRPVTDAELVEFTLDRISPVTAYAEEAMTSPTYAIDYLRVRLGPQPQERFRVLFLDTRHRVIAVEELFRGTIDGAAVYPREVARACLTHNAAAVILSHNHPSGVAEPSEADRHITTRITQALALLDIRVLDHLVITTDAAVSLAERGWLP